MHDFNWHASFQSFHTTIFHHHLGKIIPFCTPLTDLTRIHGYHSPSVAEHVSHEAAYAHSSPEAAASVGGPRAAPIPSVGAAAAEFETVQSILR